MILIADSGSTKCDWKLVNASGVSILDTSTKGFNPFFHDKDFVVGELCKNKSLSEYADSIQMVFFYGAGCSSEERNEKIKVGLKAFFKNAEVTVEHDLLAAAYSCYTGEPNITCILGTGSNSCIFDGKKTTEEIPALAYILGDEASGSYFGKRLLQAYLYKKLPNELTIKFDEEFGISKDEIFKNVYFKPHANVYLASFMKFISDNRDHPFFKLMIEEGMDEFLEKHVTCYKNYREIPVNFVGSVAYYFEEPLRDAARKFNININYIIKKPIDNLVNYHFTYILANA